MEVKEAVKIAINYVEDLFENSINIGLEEIEHVNSESDNDWWYITVGFSRPWDKRRQGVSGVLDPKNPSRVYKKIKVLGNGEIQSIEIREVNE